MNPGKVLYDDDKLEEIKQKLIEAMDNKFIVK